MPDDLKQMNWSPQDLRNGMGVALTVETLVPQQRIGPAGRRVPRQS